MKNKIDDLQDRMEIANRLKEIRKAKGFSQEEMAEKMGLATITYAKLENAAHNITTKNLKNLSRILNVTTDLILFGETGDSNINFEEYIRCAQMFSPSELDSFRGSFDLIQRLQEMQPENSEEKETANV